MDSDDPTPAVFVRSLSAEDSRLTESPDSSWIKQLLRNASALSDARFGGGANPGRDLRARSIKPFGGSRPCLRRTRALWEFKCGKEQCERVPRWCRRAHPMTAYGGEGENRGEERGQRGGEKRSVRRQDREMHSVLTHAEISSWRECFHAATVSGGGERSWISVAVNRSMTFMGPPHLGQR